MMTERKWKLLFRRRLIHMLEEKGLRQVDLANKTGIDSGAISKYCNGKKMPSTYTIVKIATALNCSLEDLCGI